jgi:hypothetical protein
MASSASLSLDAQPLNPSVNFLKLVANPPSPAASPGLRVTAATAEHLVSIKDIEPHLVLCSDEELIASLLIQVAR